MALYDARLRMPGRSKVPLGVEVDVSRERMILHTGDHELANWRLDEVEISLRPDGFHIRVDGEEVVLNVADPKRFAFELGLEGNKTASPPGLVDGDADAGGRSSLANTARAFPATSGGRPTVDQLRLRIAEVAEALTSNTVDPSHAFALWLGLLKEINHRLGQGSMSREIFYQLNTDLLELIPQPDEAGEQAAS